MQEMLVSHTSGQKYKCYWLSAISDCRNFAGTGSRAFQGFLPFFIIVPTLLALMGSRVCDGPLPPAAAKGSLGIAQIHVKGPSWPIGRHTL